MPESALGCRHWKMTPRRELLRTTIASHFHCLFRRSPFHCSGIRGWMAIQLIAGFVGVFETPAPSSSTIRRHAVDLPTLECGFSSFESTGSLVVLTSDHAHLSINTCSSWRWRCSNPPRFALPRSNDSAPEPTVAGARFPPQGTAPAGDAVRRTRTTGLRAPAASW